MKATEHKETGERMHVYEIGYLIIPSVPEDKVAEEVSRVRKLVEDAGASVISDEFPKLTQLSYQMAKSSESGKTRYDQAYFGWIKFEASVLRLKDIEEPLRHNKSIIRFLVVKTIRENTILSGRMSEALPRRSDETTSPKEAPTPSEVKKVVSQDEIDKSIDALVTS